MNTTPTNAMRLIAGDQCVLDGRLAWTAIEDSTLHGEVVRCRVQYHDGGISIREWPYDPMHRMPIHRPSDDLTEIMDDYLAFEAAKRWIDG